MDQDQRIVLSFLVVGALWSLSDLSFWWLVATCFVALAGFALYSKYWKRRVVRLLDKGRATEYLDAVDRRFSTAGSRVHDLWRVYRSLGLSVLGRYTEAVAELKTASTDTFTDREKAAHTYGLLYNLLLARRYTEAKLLADEVRDRELPSHPEPLNRSIRSVLAVSKILCGDLPKGRAELEDILGYDEVSNHVRAGRHYFLGLADLRQGRKKPASVHFEETKRLAPPESNFGRLVDELQADPHYWEHEQEPEPVGLCQGPARSANRWRSPAIVACLVLISGLVALTELETTQTPDPSLTVTGPELVTLPGRILPGVQLMAGQKVLFGTTSEAEKLAIIGPSEPIGETPIWIVLAAPTERTIGPEELDLWMRHFMQFEAVAEQEMENILLKSSGRTYSATRAVLSGNNETSVERYSLTVRGVRVNFYGWAQRFDHSHIQHFLSCLEPYQPSEI